MKARPSGSMTVAALAGALLSSPAPALSADSAQPARSLGRALREGKTSVSLRYRYEQVSDDAPDVSGKQARASTLRSTLSYRTAAWHHTRLFVEFEDVTDIGLDHQHDNAGAGGLANGVTDRPVIADPDVTELNQLTLRYAHGETTIDLGRREIVLGTQRFVGPVGWRQNHQSFDALVLTQSSIPRTKLTYIYIDKVNRIFGDDKPMASHLLDAEVSFESGKLTPYIHRLDYDRVEDAGSSSLTFGARWHGQLVASERWSVPYQLELAHQQDAADNPSAFDVESVAVEIGAASERLELKAGFERLGADANQGRFTTPLATLHKFNGWADKFLQTPAGGLEDLYLSVRGSRGAASGTLVIHDFGSDAGSIDYGFEIDGEIKYEAPWKQVFALAFALYDADQFAADTDKIWLWTSWAF
ncbi:MAG: alginate export family protein [Acidobacteriota bacterium]|nr:MAG: alginate export family protein [Acidobacteriota bacterium]